MAIDPKLLNDIWRSGQGGRERADRISSYYDGNHVAADLLKPRLDRRAKSQITTNWIKYIVDFHAQFALGSPITYRGRDGADVSAWTDFARKQNLAKQDRHHYRECLMHGKSIAIARIDAGGELHFDTTNARNWVVVRDSSGDIAMALQWVRLPRYSMHEGEILTEPVELIYLFEDGARTTYRKNRNSGWDVIDEREILIGLPLIVFSFGDDDHKPFINRPILENSDIYDITRSALSDEIKYNVDSLLKTKGVDFEPLLEQGKDGRTVLQKFLEMGFLPVSAEGDAEYMSRELRVEKYTEQLKTTRHSLHIMASLPDLDDTIGGQTGTIGSISGAALRLMYQPTIQRAHEWFGNFGDGIKKRIDTYNTVGDLAGAHTAVGDGVEWDIHLNLPENITETLQYMPNLDGILSLEDRINLLSMIPDPKAALQRKLEEQSSPTPNQTTE